VADIRMRVFWNGFNLKEREMSEEKDQKLTKTAFDNIVNRRASDKYEQSVIAFRGHIHDFFKKNPHVNNHSYGNSVHVLIIEHIEKVVRERKDHIIEAYAKDEISYILSNLENIKFLFEEKDLK
jgi:predicted fused transcriptional regulator/phosphomethylpyrimidine kinase